MIEIAGRGAGVVRRAGRAKYRHKAERRKDELT